ncbi:cytochrome P450 [Ktedonobacter sp. SOSP1-52]|uniref:cytochrome P450 n=1 Tax=Ktedonobacter sp. SOSP1-52 TaxID=2778366 RepID=UPI0019160EA4|nr:cytochrome P450 [Ktedonobacter sp. SOSP1-52]GHO62363.1 cytochrome P450 [Ktedonobacter sp. SOSP1-52]
MNSTPPMLPGSPVVGNLLEFMKDRHGLLQRGFDSLGPVFGIRLLGQPVAFLIGPEYQQIFFTETDKKLSMHKSYAYLKAALGEVGFTAPPEVYFAQRPILLKPFKSERMIKYLGIMQLEVQQWLDTLGEQGELELRAAVTQVVQNVAAHALMGKDFRDSLGPEFWKLYLILGKAIDPALPPYLPLPKFIRRDRAKKKLREMIWPFVVERRAHPEQYDDFLLDFATATYKDGTPMEDDAVIATIMGLMFAGHETTAGQAAWTIIQLLQTPSYLQLLQQEIADRFPPGEALTAKNLSSMKHTFWAVQETTRMHPSADVLARRAEEDIQVGEYRIPKGWNLMVAADIAQRLPDLFQDPATYDPLRYAPGREEDRQHRFSLIGFGGGTHKCAGMNFANNEMMIITALLFQQFDLELITKDPRVDYGLGAARPEKTYIRYKRKSTNHASPASTTEATAEQKCPYATSKTED